MAKIKEITMSKGVTINLGDYSNWKCHVGLTAELDKDDNHNDVLEDLSKEIDARLGKESEGYL